MAPIHVAPTDIARTDPAPTEHGRLRVADCPGRPGTAGWVRPTGTADCARETDGHERGRRPQCWRLGHRPCRPPGAERARRSTVGTATGAGRAPGDPARQRDLPTGCPA